jgi:hypothetical protein
MITCQKAVELTSRELDAPLPFGSRSMLGVHRWLCSACRRFRKQLIEVDEAVRDYLDAGVPTNVALPDDARQRIQQALRDEQ